MALVVLRRARRAAQRRPTRHLAAAFVALIATSSVLAADTATAGPIAPATGVSVLPVLEANYVGVVETLDAYATAVQSCVAGIGETSCFVDASATAIHGVDVYAAREATIGGLPFAERQLHALHTTELVLSRHLRGMDAYANDSPHVQVRHLVANVLPAAGAFEAHYFATASALSLEIYHSSTSLQRGTALRAAVVVGLQGSDLPEDESSTDDAIYYTAPSAAGICTPVSSQPWLADVVSDDFVTESTDDYSSIFVMPTVPYARAAARAISLPAYDTDCYVPAVEGTLLTLVTRADGCVEPAVLHTSGTIIAGAAIATDPVVDRASITVRCGASMVVATSDLLTQSIGHFVVEASFASVGAVPSSTEEATVFGAMTARAAAVHTF